MIGTKLERSPYIMGAAKVAEVGFSGLINRKEEDDERFVITPLHHP